MISTRERRYHNILYLHQHDNIHQMDLHCIHPRNITHQHCCIPTCSHPGTIATTHYFHHQTCNANEEDGSSNLLQTTSPPSHFHSISFDHTYLDHCCNDTNNEHHHYSTHTHSLYIDHSHTFLRTSRIHIHRTFVVSLRDYSSPDSLLLSSFHSRILHNVHI